MRFLSVIFLTYPLFFASAFSSQDIESLNAQMFQAVEQGDVALIKNLLKSGANPNVKDRYGFTPLMKAIANNKPSIADFLLEAGADPSGCDELKLTEAARNGNLQVLKELLNNGISINSEDVWGTTALASAVSRNQREVVEWLVASNANVNHRSTKNGSTALMNGHWKNNTESLQILLSHGADIQLKDNSGKTALMIAAEEYKNIDSIRLFLEFGANIDDRDNEGNNALMLSLSHPRLVKGDLMAVVGALVSAGSEVNLPNKYGKTAASLAFAGENIEVLHLIVPKVQGNFWKGAEDDFRRALRNPQLIQLYLAAGADVNAGDELGWNFLRDAVTRGTTESATLLVSAGADVNKPDRNGVTPLAYAVTANNTEMVLALLSVGAKTKDSDLLVHSLTTGHFEIAEALKNAGATLDNEESYILKGKFSKFLRQQDQNRAEEILQQLQKNFPDSDVRDEIIRLANFVFNLGRYEHSITLYQQIIEAYHGSATAVSAYYHISDAYEKLGMEPEMAKALEDAHSYNVTIKNSVPNEIIGVESYVVEKLAKYYMKKGRWIEALELWKEWIPANDCLGDGYKDKERHIEECKSHLK